jgi:hypothetical protein
MTEQTMALVPNMTQGDLAELLFCSTLQPSQDPDPEAVVKALSQSLRSHHGQILECAEELAASYGKDPEITCLRMRWARTVIARTFPAARAAS